MIIPVWIIGFVGHRPKESAGRTCVEVDLFVTKKNVLIQQVIQFS